MSLTSMESGLMRFGSHLSNEIIGKPRRVAYDVVYGTVASAVLSMTPISSWSNDIASSLTNDTARQDDIASGIHFAIFRATETAVMKSWNMGGDY